MNYHVLLQSNSWKITKPYRYLGDKYRWFGDRVKAWITFAPHSRPRRVLKGSLISLKYRLNKHPRLKDKILNILDRFPKIKTRLRQVEKRNLYIKNEISQNEVPKNSNYQQLSNVEKRIYDDLKKTIESRKQKGDNKCE